MHSTTGTVNLGLGDLVVDVDLRLGGNGSGTGPVGLVIGGRTG